MGRAQILARGGRGATVGLYGLLRAAGNGNRQWAIPVFAGTNRQPDARGIRGVGNARSTPSFPRHSLSNVIPAPAHDVCRHSRACAQEARKNNGGNPAKLPHSTGDRDPTRALHLRREEK